jgi:hypothetical protein
MLQNVQIITEQGKSKFAVIDFDEYLSIKELLSSEDKLQDYLDYLHIQKVKQQNPQRLTLDQIKQSLFVESDH